MASSSPTNSMTHALYERLKSTALVVLPALATLYFGIAEIWHLGYGPQVVASITAVDTFLGLLLKVSSASYYSSGANFDGQVVVTPDDGGTKATLAADYPLEDIVDDPGKHSVEFQVVRTNTPSV